MVWATYSKYYNAFKKWLGFVFVQMLCTFREAEPWRNILMPWSKSCLILQVFNSKGKDFLQYPPIYSWNLIRMLKHVTHSLFIFREFTCTLKRLNICSREEQVIYFKPFILFHKSLLHFPRKICSKSHIKHVMSPRYVQRFTTKNSLCTMMIYVLALYWILIYL